MRDRNKQRVVCTSCGWSGGRAASSQDLLKPCFRCGSVVEKVGAVFVEERVLACCQSCNWWGEVQPSRLGGLCSRCDRGGTVERALVVTVAGAVIA